MNTLPQPLALLVLLFVIVAPYWCISGTDIVDSEPVLKAPPVAAFKYDCSLFELVTSPSPGETVVRYLSRPRQA
jgi:hypothetical protein